MQMPTDDESKKDDAESKNPATFAGCIKKLPQWVSQYKFRAIALVVIIGGLIVLALKRNSATPFAALAGLSLLVLWFSESIEELLKRVKAAGNDRFKFWFGNSINEQPDVTSTETFGNGQGGQSDSKAALQTRQPSERQNDAVDNEINQFGNSIHYQFIEKNARDYFNKRFESNGDEARIEFLEKLVAAKTIIAHFEYIYSAIFGGQIELLKRLNFAKAGDPQEGGLSLDIIDWWYTNTLQPSLPKEWGPVPTSHYLRFLESHQLIFAKNNIYQISDKGKDFLMWMVKNGREEKKLF